MPDRRSWPAYLAAVAVGYLVGLGTAWWLLRPEPLVLTVPTPPPPPTPAPIVVDVSGAVAHPGLYTLPAGARVADAVEAAGGLTEKADRAAVNLAQPLADGSHVHVPAVGEARRTPTPSVAFPVDINRASPDELTAVPGIGPTLAERIVANRPYSSVDDLLRVPGIGPATLEKLRPYVTVGP